MKIPSAQRLLHQTSTIAVAFFLACAALLPAVAQAQSATGRITGHVLNKATNDYLRNATVSIPGTEISVISEAGGAFSLDNVPVGPQTVQIVYVGLDTKTETVNVTAGQTTTLEVAMTNAEYTDIVKLDKFVVPADREGNAKVIMEQKNSIEAKAVLAADSFGSISEGNVGEFLKYLPGVQVDYTEADARQVSLGGLDPKYTGVTIDGAPVASSGVAAQAGTGGNRAFEFEQVSIHNIETVELSRTPQPENSGSAMAGVVNLRSRGAFDSSGRRITLQTGIAWNSMSGNPFQKQAGWDDEKHYRVYPNYKLTYSDAFLNKRLGVTFGFNYSFTFSEQKALTVNYAFDGDLTNNDTEVPRINSFSYRDSPKPTIRTVGTARVDFKITPDWWVSMRADHNRYHGAFFSRDLTFSMTPTSNQTMKVDGKDTRVNFNNIANSPDPDGAPGANGAGRSPAGPVMPGVPFSLSSQTVVVGTPGYTDAGVLVPAAAGPGGNISLGQGGGGFNKYGQLTNFFFGSYFKRGSFRADVVASMSRSMTWYKDRQFGFFQQVDASALNNVGFRFDRNGPSDPALFITQTSGKDWRDLNSYPLGFRATTSDRQGEEQKWQFRADLQYNTRLKSVPTVFKGGLAINQLVNNADRPLANYNQAIVGLDGKAATADENLALWAEPHYRMQFDFGGNVDGMTNIDRWAVYKMYRANEAVWRNPTQADLVAHKLANARDVTEQVDALYEQTQFKLGKLTVAPGVRYERTRGKASGPANMGNRAADLIYFGTTKPMSTIEQGGLGLTSQQVSDARGTAEYIMIRNGGARQSARQDYSTWLRYFHTTYRFNENLVLKGSWNQAVSRVDMNRLMGGLTVTEDDPDDPKPNRASAGNTNLIPEQSRTANLTLEYYTKGIGQIRVSGYRRDFKNQLRGVTYILPPGSTWNDEPLPTSVSPNEPWEISTVANVRKSHMSSLEFEFRRELDFLPAPFNRTLLVSNYSRMFFDEYDNFSRVRNTANLIVTIPYKDLSVGWRTNWVPGRRFQSVSSNGGWAGHMRETLTHTLDVNYRFSRTFSFYLTARNIFNQDGGEYRGRSDVRARWIQTGAIWTAGMNANF